MRTVILIPTTQFFISFLLLLNLFTTKSFAFATSRSSSSSSSSSPNNQSIDNTIETSMQMSSSDNEKVNVPNVGPVGDHAADDTTSNNNSQEGEAMALPPADPNNKDIPKLKFGETLRLDAWGPIILNTDGTTRRISNWENLTEKEQEVTWRRIKKRNEERRKILLEPAEKEEHTTDTQSKQQEQEL